MSRKVKEPKEQKIPVRVQRIVDAVAAGQTLFLCYRFKESGETEHLYRLEPSGMGVGLQSAAEAIQDGHLTPLGDGLFGMSQSWRG